MDIVVELEPPKLKLTIKQLRVGYDYLCATVPMFKSMPPESRICFKITNATMTCGMYEPDPHRIAVSRKTNANHTSVLQTLAHEMLHAHLEIKGRGGHENHNGDWSKYAALVCDTFGWKYEDF